MKKQGKKVLIGIALISILIGGVFLSLYLNKGYTSKECDIESQEKVIENEVDQKESPIVVELPEVKDYDKETIEENIGSGENKETSEVKQENNKDERKATEAKQEIKDNSKLDNKTETPKKEDNKPKEQISNIPKEEPKQEIVTQIPIEIPKEESKEEPVEIPKKDEHTYKYNATIVEKIKNDIKNNESTYMKQYGYNIVIDEGIITQTNQFTYTDVRVKNMIKNKFGTIKIYARDYYLNGNYMYTESYIL